MELSDLSFMYGLDKGNFAQIEYGFNLLPNPESNAETAKLVKEMLQNFDSMIMKYYNQSVERKETGIVTSTSVYFGYDYSTSKQNLGKEFIQSKLHYRIVMGSRYKSLNLNFTNRDANSSRILSIYDSIMSLPDLKILREPQIQADKINFLRNKKFGLEEYLSLPNKK